MRNSNSDLCRPTVPERRHLRNTIVRLRLRLPARIRRNRLRDGSEPVRWKPLQKRRDVLPSRRQLPMLMQAWIQGQPMRNRYRRLRRHSVRTRGHLRRLSERPTMPVRTRIRGRALRDPRRLVPGEALRERWKMPGSRQRLRVPMPARLRREGLQYRHRRVRLLAVPERGVVPGPSERVPLRLFRRVGWEGVHGVAG